MTDLLPAQNLEDAIFLCNPQIQLLTSAQLDAFFVDRESIARSEMRTHLVASDLKRGQSVKFLFTGHIGGGKSSELNKLSREIEDRFFVVPVSFGGRPDITYVDVIVKAANKLLTYATDQNFLDLAVGQIVFGHLQKIREFIQTGIVGDLPFRNRLGEATGNLGVKFHLFGLEFEGKYDTEASSRDKIRANSSSRLEEFVKYIDDLSKDIRDHAGKPVLFIFSDTEKLDFEPASKLFLERARTITSFLPSAIYQFPINLRWSTQISSISGSFSEIYVLENLKIKNRSGQTHQPDFERMRTLISLRVSPALFESGAEDRLIMSSGGHVRSLIRLVNSAALGAQGRNAKQISVSDAIAAEKKMRGQFISMLTPDAYPILKARYDDKQISADPRLQNLLQSLALMEYANGGDPWCDVHPAILPTVLERTAKQ